MRIHYLEIVTPDVDSTCTTWARQHGVSFSEAVPELGNARTAQLAHGGMIGVRVPMHEAETPIIRPYLKVADLAEAVASAQKAGAEILLPAMEISGRGQIAIFAQGGVQYGVWQE